MSREPAGIAVVISETGQWLTAAAGGEALQRLAGAALDPALLRQPSQAAVQLQLVAAGWERLNLGSLVARARATPGVPLAMGDPLLARAWAGSRTEPRVMPRSIAIAGRRPTAVLLDRDGTIIEDRHYLADPGGVSLLPGAAAGLARMGSAGIRLAVLTNQSGVARGLVAAEALPAIHARLGELLAQAGARLDGIYACPHDAAAGCRCRKPADGLARQAATELGLDLTSAIVVGDKAADLLLARGLGLPAVLVTTGEGRATLDAGAPVPDLLVDGLDELARIVLHPAGLAWPAAA